MHRFNIWSSVISSISSFKENVFSPLTSPGFGFTWKLYRISLSRSKYPYPCHSYLPSSIYFLTISKKHTVHEIVGINLFFDISIFSNSLFYRRKEEGRLTTSPRPLDASRKKKKLLKSTDRKTRREDLRGVKARVWVWRVPASSSPHQHMVPTWFRAHPYR